MRLLQNLRLKSARGTISLLFACYRAFAPTLLLFGVMPSCCRFLPTCSEYAQEAVRRHAWKGVLMATLRLLRCRPLLFAPKQSMPQSIRFDPVPPRADESRQPVKGERNIVRKGVQ